MVLQHYINERYRLLGGAENKSLTENDLKTLTFENDILGLLERDAKDQKI